MKCRVKVRNVKAERVSKSLRLQGQMVDKARQDRIINYSIGETMFTHREGKSDYNHIMLETYLNAGKKVAKCTSKGMEIMKRKGHLTSIELKPYNQSGNNHGYPIHTD